MAARYALVQFTYHDTVANQEISRVASVRSNAAKPLGKRQRGRILAEVHMISPQSAKCPQLTVRVTEHYTTKAHDRWLERLRHRFGQCAWPGPETPAARVSA